MDLVLPSACIRCVCAKQRGGMHWCGRDGFSSGVNFIVRLPPACLAQTGEKGMPWSRRDGFSSGVNFTGCLSPVCLCKPVRGECIGTGGWIFPADLVLPSAYLRFVWRKPASGKCVWAGGWIFRRSYFYRLPASGGIGVNR